MNTLKHYFIGISLIAVLFFSGCGGSDSTSSDAPFSVSPTSLSFTAKLGDTPPTSKIVTITKNRTDAEKPTFEFTGSALANVVYVSGTSSSMDLRVSATDPDNVGIGTYSGTITISSSEHTEVVTVNYTVTGATPVVSSIQPYVATAGEAGTVMISGGGFSYLEGTPTVMFGDTPALSTEVIDDSLIRAERPALAAGSYNVSISGNVNFPSNSTVEVINPPGYSAFTSSEPSSMKSKVVEDPERSAFFVANITEETIKRYTYDSGLGWTVDSVSLSKVYDIALQPGGDWLIAVAGSSVYAIDPAAETMTTTLLDTASEVNYGYTCGAHFGTIEFASTGKALLLEHIPLCTGGLERFEFDPSDHSVTYLEGLSFDLWLADEKPVIEATSTGEILATESSSVNQLDAINYTLVTTDIPASSKIAANANGNVIATERKEWNGVEYVYTYEVFDKNFTSLGVFTPATVFDAIAVSPDGSRLYGYESAGSTVAVYDLTATDGTSQFSTLGTPTVIPSNPVAPATLTVSQDGQALIFSGSDNVVVVPVSSL